MPAGAPTDREGRVFEPAIDLLPLDDQILDEAPQADIEREQRQPQIGAEREVGRVVVDYQGTVPRRHQLDRRRQQVQAVGIERVLLGGELEAQGAVAEVPQGGRAVGEEGAGAALDVGEPERARRPLDGR